MHRNATRMIMLVMNLIVSPVWAAPGDVTINKTNFPDAAFLGYVKAKIDNNDDGILSQSEIDLVKQIKITGVSVYDLKGIEHFTNLEKLYCYGVKLKSLDCRWNNLTELDVTKNSELVSFNCSENKLTDIDVSKNTKLESLRFYSNKLTSLDLSKNTKLAQLDYENCRQKYATQVDGSTLKFELTSLHGNFNPSKTSAWTGGKCFRKYFDT